MAAKIIRQPAILSLPEFPRNWWERHSHLCGRILLQGDFLVSSQCRRPKLKKVILFENRLCLFRYKGSIGSVVHDIPVEDMMLITYRSTRSESMTLTMYWCCTQGDSEKPREVTSAEIYFTDLYALQLWAGFLAMALELNEGGWHLTSKNMKYLLARIKSQKRSSTAQDSSLKNTQMSDAVVPQRPRNRRHKKWKPLTRHLLNYHWDGNTSSRIICLSNCLTVRIIHDPSVNMEKVDLEVDFIDLISERPGLKHWLSHMMTEEVFPFP